MKNIFLATTALSEFWDMEADEIVFLGDWCLTYDNREIIKKMNYKVLTSPWEDEYALNKAREHVDSVYKKFLTPVSCLLNEIHGMDENEGFWDIIIGGWLKWYIGIMYSHYCKLKLFLQDDLRSNTIILDENAFRVTQDFLEFFDSTWQDDLYNLQLFSKLMLEMKHNISIQKKIKYHDKQDKQNNNAKSRFNWKRFVWNVVSLTQHISPRNAILLDHEYLHPKYLMFFWFGSLGKIAFNNKIIKTDSFEANNDLRRKCSLKLDDIDEFEAIIKKTLIHDIPIVYVEGFKNLTELSRKYYAKQHKVIASSSSWYFHEAFKVHAAKAKSNGARLIGIQHGGYGTTKADLYLPEFNILDRFYSWGWVNSRKMIKGTEIKKGIMWKTLGIMWETMGKKVENAHKRELLFINTAVLRYNPSFDKLSFYFNDYYQDQLIFVHNLNAEVQNNLLIRTYGNNNHAIERYQDAFPNIKIDSYDSKFYRSLSNKRLAIIDYTGTTPCETIAMNIPTILFWRPEYNDFMEEAEPIYEGLKKVGIFHESPESAARYINEIYDDIEGWWNESERQKAVDAFRRQFACVPKTPFKWWLKEFKDIIKETKRMEKEIIECKL